MTLVPVTPGKVPSSPTPGLAGVIPEPSLFCLSHWVTFSHSLTLSHTGPRALTPPPALQPGHLWVSSRNLGSRPTLAPPLSLSPHGQDGQGAWGGAWLKQRVPGPGEPWLTLGPPVPVGTAPEALGSNCPWGDAGPLRKAEGRVRGAGRAFHHCHTPRLPDRGFGAEN